MEYAIELLENDYIWLSVEHNRIKRSIKTPPISLHNHLAMERIINRMALLERAIKKLKETITITY